MNEFLLRLKSSLDIEDARLSSSFMTRGPTLIFDLLDRTALSCSLQVASYCCLYRFGVDARLLGARIALKRDGGMG